MLTLSICEDVTSLVGKSADYLPVLALSRTQANTWLFPLRHGRCGNLSRLAEDIGARYLRANEYHTGYIVVYNASSRSADIYYMDGFIRVKRDTIIQQEMEAFRMRNLAYARRFGYTRTLLEICGTLQNF